MNLLALIPAGYRWLALGLALAALVAAWQGERYFHGQARFQEGKQSVQQVWDAQVSRDRAEALALAQANAKETQRRLERQQDAQHVHDQEVARARADAAIADAAAGRLSRQLAAFVAAARGGPGDPAAAVDGAPGDDPIGVLADVFSRADRRAGELAQVADAARAAGLQCERSYDALTP